ncbi:MAG: hypothetical protein NC131_10905 [Roseburia sp.]|nr:hypothetical protein [Roseburia sp.]
MSIDPKTLNALCYIQEQTSFIEDYGDQFGYEVHPRGDRFFVTFDGVLQSFGVKNRNRREYEADNIMHLIQTDDYITSMLRQNSWMGEIDHPAPEKKGEDLTLQRIANPDLKMTSHYVRKPHLEGNLLVAKIQTDSGTQHGMNMAIKIVDGHIIPCFSARVLGELMNKAGRAVVHVKKLICYDWVLYPSHPEAMARINQPLMESVEEGAIENYDNCTVIFLHELARMAAHSSKETEWLCESFGLTADDIVGVTTTGNSVVIKEHGNTYIQPLSDKLVRQQTRSMVQDWLNS